MSVLDKLRNIKLVIGDQGARVDDKGRLDDNQICVMEALSYVTGQAAVRGRVTDNPACASGVVTSLLITYNDGVNHQRRAQLKKLIPTVIGTAPTRRVAGRVFKDHDRATYLRAEAKRAEIVAEALGLEDGYPDYERVTKFSIPKLEKLVNELTDVKRWKAPEWR